MIKRLKEIAEKYQLYLPVYGHAGDGNLHPNIICTCQAYCPLYQETGKETMVARGKIELLDLVANNKLVWNDKLAEIFSTCLLCGNCSANCPNMVKADLLVREGCRELVAAHGLPIIKRTIFEQLFKKDGRLRLMARLLYLYQNLGIWRLVTASKILRLFPGNLAEKESLLPKLTAREFRKSVPKVIKADNPRLRVGYFTGCMTNYIYPQTGHSLLKVLRANGVEVLIPDQSCCGIPALQIKLPQNVKIGTVTYHDPCHLKRLPGGKEHPRTLLGELGEGSEFVEMKDADRCCGSAGSFNLTHYKLSQQVVQTNLLLKVSTKNSLFLP